MEDTSVLAIPMPTGTRRTGRRPSRWRGAYCAEFVDLKTSRSARPAAHRPVELMFRYNFVPSSSKATRS